MLYFASSRNPNFVSKIVDSVGPLSNVAADDTRLRGDRNDEQHIEEPVKQKVEIDWPPYETIGCHCVHIRILCGLYLLAKPSVYLAV